MECVSNSSLRRRDWYNSIGVDGHRRFVSWLRMIVGVMTCLLSLLDINHGKGMFSEDERSFRFEAVGSPIYVLTTKSLVYVLLTLDTLDLL